MKKTELQQANRNLDSVNMKNGIVCMVYEKRYTEKPNNHVPDIQKNFVKKEIAIEELAYDLCHGATFRPAVLVGGNEATDWSEQQLFVLDLDDGIRIDDAYDKAVALGINPCFIYTSFNHKEDHHKFHMVFCSDVVITDGDKRDRMQATLMGVMGAIDTRCSNRDRIFFGGKGKIVLYPDYSQRINGEWLINEYWKEDFKRFIHSNQKNTGSSNTKRSRISSNNDYCQNNYINVQAIREHDVPYLREALRHEPIEFETSEELWNYVYTQLDIAELIGINYPRSFCCILHDDHHPSANIFTAYHGIQKYRCCSEDITLNIKELVKILGNFPSDRETVQFIKDIYNLSIKKTSRSEEKEHNIDTMIDMIRENQFKDICPQTDKNIRYAKNIFVTMLMIAKRNTYDDDLTTNKGEVVFFITIKNLADMLGKRNNQKSIDKVAKYVKILCYHGLLRVLDDSEVPEDILKKAIEYSGINKRSGHHVNFYAVPSWDLQELEKIEEKGMRWKKKGYTVDGVSFEMFLRSEGYDVAASMYPQYKYKRDDMCELVKRTASIASDKRTEFISQVILEGIQKKGYSSEKEVKSIKGGLYKHDVTELQIKRSLNEIMDTYSFIKVKANKSLKEKYHIASDGYPYIIIRKEED